MSLSNSNCECCKAHWIEFKLCEELRCTSDKACARIVKHWQGEMPPTSHCNEADCTGKCAGVGDSALPTVCVFNQPDGGPGNTTDPQRYVFTGVKGDLGVACYDDLQDRYRIVLIRSSDAAIKWGIAVDNSRDGGDETNAPDCPYVKVRPCFDCEGNGLNPDTNVIDFVVLPERSGYAHDIKQGDVIAYTSAYDDSRKQDGTALPKRRWVIVSDYTKGTLVRFKLTESLETGSSAEAVIRVFNGTAYVDGDAIRVFDWYGISQGGRGMFQGISGMEGYAALREKKAEQSSQAPDEYDIVWMEQYAKAVEFTLTAAMANGYAPATVTASWDQGVEPGSEITVHDDQGRWPDAIAGCKGTAWRSEYADPTNPATPYYKIISCTRAVREVTATLNDEMCGGVPVVTGWTPVPIGEHQVDPGQGTLTNPRGHYGQSGDLVLLLRTNNSPPFSWAVVDVTLHAIEVPVEFRYHEDSCQVQVRKQQIAIERCTPVGDWQTLLQMTEVTYVTGTEQAAAGSGSSATCTVEHTVAKACVFGVAAAQPNITALTLTRVDPVVDVESRPTELVQTLQPVWVICAGTAYEVQIDTIDECPTGSGSGYT